MSILDRLNEKQREAAEKIEGALLILAGAGSGKTRTITYRIAHMVKEKGISPYKILAVTFTNKAAREMKERVESLIGDEAKKCMIATFHSFGVRLLRAYGTKLGYDANFTIYDVDDQKRVVKGILKELVVEDKNLTEGVIVSKISKLKEDGVTPQEYEKERKFDTNYKIVLECYRRYNVILKQNNAMDFSDILVNLYELLKIDEILEKLQDKFQYIMIDEYQDTNNLQYLIVSKLAAKHRNICVVGDENQSIYGFRGANIQNILDFEKDYPEALIVKLEENYRSTSAILTAANEVIKNNKTSKDKKLWTRKEMGELIALKQCNEAREEVYYVVEEIIKRKKEGRKYKDFTILYRTNAQSRLFEEEFLRYGIPYKVFGGVQFYQRAEIKNILAYLSLINNPKDGVSLNRIINVPKRKIGDATLKKIEEYAQERNITLFEAILEADNIKRLSVSNKVELNEFGSLIKRLNEAMETSSVTEIFNEIISGIGYYSYLKSNYGDEAEARIENVEELKSSIVEMERKTDFLSLKEYLENVALVSATDDLEESRDYVKLMTIHNSKGLEFPIVFLVGMEDEFFPGTRKVAFNEDELEEERRLCYVAITRAEEKLYVSYANLRVVYGKTEDRQKSRFIDEFPPETMEKFIINTPKIIERKEQEKVNLGFKKLITTDDLKRKNIDTPFNLGDKVMHIKFGLGNIIEITDKKIGVQFLSGKKDIALILATKFLTKI